MPVKAPAPTPPGGDVQLPFDPMTVVRGILRHKLLVLAFAVLSVALGSGVGWMLGKRTYEATSLLQYRVTAGAVEGAASSAPSLVSLLQQVEVRPSIEALRERLQLEISIEGLGYAVEADIPENSQLLTFKATWKDPHTAARVANKLRDIFVERWCHMLVQAVEALDDQSKARLQAAITKEANFQKVIAELQTRAADERKGASGATDIQLRYGRLKEMIEEDRSARANAIELTAREGELVRAQRLKEQGLISDPDYQTIASAVEKQRALTQDTARTARWKAELDSLRSQAGKAEAATPAEQMLQQVVVQALSAEMDRVAMQDQVADIERAIALAKQRLAGFAALDAESERSDKPGVPIAELLGIQTELSSVRKLYDTESPEFSLVSEAIPPVMPAKSTRKLIAVGGSVGLFFLALFALIVAELFHGAVRSGGDVTLKTGRPPLAVLPLAADLEGNAHEFEDGCRLLSRALRAEVHKPSATYLVTGPRGGEGTSTLIERLASVLGAIQGPVLVIDVNGATAGGKGITDRLVKAAPMGVGLGTVLDEGLDALVYAVRPTRLQGVFLLPADERSFAPSALGHKGFGALLAEVGPRYSAIFLDGPPVLSSAVSVFLTEWVDLTVLVVRGGETSKRDLERTLERLDKAGGGRRLTVLNGADPVFNPA